MRKVLFFFLTLTLFQFDLQAQNFGRPWTVGFSGGKTAYIGDIGNGMFNFEQRFRGHGAFSVTRYLNSNFDIAFNGTYGRFGYWQNNKDQFLSNMFHGNLVAHFKFNNGYILGENAILAPYIFGGMGFSDFKDVDDRANNNTAFTVPIGVGINLNFTNKWGIFWQSTFGFTTSDITDKIDEGGPDHFFQNQIGVKFSFGNTTDRDKDGTPDKEDSCPDEPGPRSMDGCPDTDEDGVSDYEDECPYIPGDMTNNGCPEISEETQEVLDDALEGVFFETNKAVIRPESFTVLDRVVEVMEENETYKLRIEGHTDSTGDDALNQSLSERRAGAVRDYLIRKGIAGERLTSEGFGESRPIASNETTEGRAKNRRVEFKIEF